MSKEIRLGIIGAGRIGKVHATNCAYRIPGVRINWITDVNLSEAKSVAEELAIPKHGEDYKEFLNDSETDAVLICSSTDTHADMIEEAARAGKHIFCEKPVDLTVDRIKSALAEVEKAGVKLHVGFNRRFDPNFKRVADQVREGAIGEPHMVRITSRDPMPPPIEYVKVSGGIFLDMTIHDFDMARYLVGDDEVVEVFATGSNLVDPEIKNAGDLDSVTITMRYKSGAMCVIDNSRKAVYGYDQRVEVFGSKGCLTVENNRPSTAELWNESGQHQDLPLFFFLERYTESYIAEVKDFVNALRENKETSVTGDDGLKAVLLGLAANRSYQEKRLVEV